MMRILIALARLIALLDRKVKSVDKDSLPNEHKQNPDPLRVDIQSEIRLPVAITQHYESEQHDREWKNR
jgi:hypothetical protein